MDGAQREAKIRDDHSKVIFPDGQIGFLLARLDDVRADLDNDSAHLAACKRGMRELRDLLAEHGVEKMMPWPEWLNALRGLLSAPK